MAETLDKWVKEGKSVKRFDMISCVNQLRRFKKYKHAAQIYEWMEKSKNDLNNADRAIRIDLLAKTEGIAQAENYFNSLQESAKTNKTYGALLNCYCKENMLDKAVELFKKLKELNFVSSALSYNNMISLYLRVGQPEKVPSLVHEMEEKDIPADLYTYNLLMNSYASVKDFEAVEQVLEKMKKRGVERDWFTYGNLANIYVDAGHTKKANYALQKLEQNKNLHDPEAFRMLINLYARTSNLEGVNRAWESLKLAHPKINNKSYLIMLLALSKLGDVAGLEKCFKEWESGCSTYDVRLSNVMLESYLNREMIEEANLLSESIAKRGPELKLKTLDLFMKFYLKKHQLDLAMKYLDMGASKADPENNKWFPTEETITMFLEYFEEVKDVDSAEKFCETMRKISRLDSKIYDSLLRTYIAAGKEEPLMSERMKDNGIEISSETEKLLQKVCPK